MTSPTDLVTVSQADLDGFATQINSAVQVLAPYIAQLVASGNLSPADESNVNAAINALVNLEPPAPAGS